jgi:hypothetical protein
VHGDLVLSVEQVLFKEDVRRARDAHSAHLEAMLKVFGGQTLRLQRLRDVLTERDAINNDLDLKASPGEPPQLWLNLSHCVTMEPDAGTYRLAFHGQHTIETLLETNSFDVITAHCLRVMAHFKVNAARDSFAQTTDAVWDQATLVYVWFTGLVTGVAALTLYAIILKKLVL